MTIGAFSRATGLSPGALRFYSDSALLSPHSVDTSSGYRYYTHDQIERAVTIRRLRETGMPLDAISRVLGGDVETIAQHLTNLIDEVGRARRTAADLHGASDTESRKNVLTLNGPVFAAAIDQILGATGHHPDHPVLGGVYVETAGSVMTLTATDRFRLATRTVVVEQSDSGNLSAGDLTAVIDGDDLRAALPAIRARHRVQMAFGDSGVVFGPDTPFCRTLTEQFPDYRSMLESLPAVVTRVVVERSELTKAIEDHQGQYLSLVVTDGTLRVSALGSGDATDVRAVVSGPDVELAFAMTTLYPAITPVVGPELMLDVSGPNMPVVIRSADDGDLTTLAMPIDADGVE